MRSPPAVGTDRWVHAMTAMKPALAPGTYRESIDPRASAERDAILANPGFGGHFTDNMVRAKWTADKGWHDAELVAYGPLLLDPATNFIHYGQAIFEGLKAYRHADGSIKTFRPFKNAQRFAASARRLAMAELPEELFVASMKRSSGRIRWVPHDAEKTLYLDLLFLGEIGLGVKPADSYENTWSRPRPAPIGRRPQADDVWLSDDFVRAAPEGPEANAGLRRR